MKKRFLCIYFPNWSVDLIQRTLPLHVVPDGILLVGKMNNQTSVIRQCSKAKRTGIKVGSALSLAQAFLPNALVKDFDPVSDFKALYKLCAWTNKYTPLNGMDVELIESYKQKLLWKINSLHYGINLDITGTERLSKGEYTLVKNINDKMIKARFEAKIAVASTFGAAWALSRFLPEKIYISKNSCAQELNTLSVESLRLAESTTAALKDVGIKNIGTLLTLPRKAIVKRYGSKTLRRLDQALGDEPEHVSAVPMPDRWAVYREFEYAVNDHEQIVELALQMIEELVKILAEKGLRTNYFLFILQGEDLWGVSYRIKKEFSVLIGSSNSKHLKTILFPLIERLYLPGPVYFLILSTNNTQKIEQAQTDLEGNLERKIESIELINQLAAEVGTNNIKELRFTNSYLPETSFTFSPIGQSDPNSSLVSKLRSRPSKILEVPQEISTIAMLPDCAPVKITWEGKELKVLKGFGPERITTPWFQCNEQELIARDYYKVEDETGRWLWIFKNTENFKWFLQGLWM